MGALWLQEWMSALLNCLPAAQRARARLRMELDRMQARARRMGWSKIALIASLAIMVKPCCCFCASFAGPRCQKPVAAECHVLPLACIQAAVQGVA